MCFFIFMAVCSSEWKFFLLVWGRGWGSVSGWLVGGQLGV